MDYTARISSHNSPAAVKYESPGISDPVTVPCLVSCCQLNGILVVPFENTVPGPYLLVYLCSILHTPVPCCTYPSNWTLPAGGRRQLQCSSWASAKPQSTH